MKKLFKASFDAKILFRSHDSDTDSVAATLKLQKPSKPTSLFTYVDLVASGGNKAVKQSAILV